MGGAIVQSARERPDVVRCLPDVLPEAVALLGRVRGRDDPAADPARAEWLYTRNPHGAPGGCSLWLAFDGARLVGVDGSVPFVLHVDGTRYRAQWGIDLVVEPEARGQGIAASLNEALRRDADVSCSVGMSDGGYLHALRNVYLDLGALPVYAHVIRPGAGEQADAISTRARRALGGAFACAAIVGRGRDMLRRGTPAGVRLVEVDSFGTWSDEVWAACAPSYRVLAARDRATLAWRYDDGPLRRAYRRYRLLRADAPVGYVVVRDTEWRGTVATAIVDYLSVPGDLPFLFREVARRARAEGSSAILCRTLSTDAATALRRAGYVRLPRASRSTRFMVHPTGDGVLDRVLGVPDHWFVTRGDSDQDLDGC